MIRIWRDQVSRESSALRTVPAVKERKKEALRALSRPTSPAIFLQNLAHTTTPFKSGHSQSQETVGFECLLPTPQLLFR